MIRTFARYIGQYKRDTILTPLGTALEVLMEVLIPFVTASIIDEGIQAGDMGKVWLYGGLMLACAFGSALSSAVVGFFAARIAAAVAFRLRGRVFEKVESFSMEG